MSFGSLQDQIVQLAWGLGEGGLPDCLHDHDDHPVHRHDGGDGAEGADREDEDANTVKRPVRLPAVAGRAARVAVGFPHHGHCQTPSLSPWGDVLQLIFLPSSRLKTLLSLSL